MANGNYNKRKGGYKKKRAGKYRKPSIPRAMNSNQGTLFPLTRTSLLSTTAAGNLDCVWAIGNISILGPPSQKSNAAGPHLRLSLAQHGRVCWIPFAPCSKICVFYRTVFNFYRYVPAALPTNQHHP